MKVSRYWWCFFFGYMMANGHDMFMQDIWGLEKYIEVVKLHWVNLHWTVGLALMCLAAFLADWEIKKAKREWESKLGMVRRLKELDRG